MDRQNPLQPFWYNASATEESALSQEPRDRRTRDENAGGTRFHTRTTGESVAAAEALVRKRLHGQDEFDQHKRRTLGNSGNSSVINSDAMLSSEDIPTNRTLYKTSSRPSNASSDSVYFFNRIPSSPPAMNDIPSSPQREDPDNNLFTSQATMVPIDETYSSDSEDTVDFNINTLNRVHGYISSDYLASEPTFGDHYNDEEVNLNARHLIAKAIEDADPKVYLESMGLKTLPEDVEDLKNLVVWGANGVEVPRVEIYATHNRLRILPPALFNVSNLSVLSLRNNRLKKIPGKICQLQNLTYLSVVNNEIKVLPYQILKLPKLTNLLVRPNSNLFELKDQEIGSYYPVSHESESHTTDVRRFVSKVKWIDLPLTSSSQISPRSIDDREMCALMPPVPKLSELALRCFSRYSVTLTETRQWKRQVPTVRQKMIAKALQKGIYDENCSVCDRITVNPIAKALEWWDFKSQTLVPVRRNFCCANCVKRWLDDVDADKVRYENELKGEKNQDVEVEEEHDGPVAHVRHTHDGLRFDEEF